ncbi:hypothetical protein [Pediococcus pentosaceus]|nr:hypothetical protein [Pediococcus pentosaceus]KAF0467570.1 hypothetical protein GBP05_05025 [Pediococcus pentosaceus]MBF7101970.1 hypothetical protein [Pediococcus pentosaceus]MBF7128852.1 hypothetical protein [Pediococcus pentosaceus]MBF7132020.1 hypothetical protein [Pediococcus pentosaceus]MBF7137739.1 hypothetical protein [Pediococcus pentosaceus]
MVKTWLKTGISITMEGPDHEKVVRRTFSNVAQTVTAEQVTELAKTLEMVSTDNVTDAQITTTEKVILEK